MWAPDQAHSGESGWRMGQMSAKCFFFAVLRTRVGDGACLQSACRRQRVDMSYVWRERLARVSLLCLLHARCWGGGKQTQCFWGMLCVYTPPLFGCHHALLFDLQQPMPSIIFVFFGNAPRESSGLVRPRLVRQALAFPACLTKSLQWTCRSWLQPTRHVS